MKPSSALPPEGQISPRMPTSPWYPRLVFVKAAVSLISLAAVFLFLDVDAFVGYVDRLGIGIVALNCLVLFAMCCALAWRWHLVLTVLEQRIASLALLIRAVTVGLFFNSVLPAGTAGDAIRILSVCRAGVPLKEAILGVLADRVIAFAVLIGLACLFVPLLAPEFGSHVVAYLAVIGMLAIAGFAFLLFFRRMFLGRLRPEVVQKEDALGRKLVAWFLRFMFATSAFFEHLVRRPALLATVLTLIVVNQAGTTLIFHLTLDALGVATNYAQLFVLLTPAIVISLLPVSYGGWGTREIAIAFFLAPAGVDASAAVAASVIFGLANLLLGLLFLPGWLWEERAHRSRDGGT